MHVIQTKLPTTNLLLIEEKKCVESLNLKIINRACNMVVFTKIINIIFGLSGEKDVVVKKMW